MYQYIHNVVSLAIRENETILNGKTRRMIILAITKNNGETDDITLIPSVLDNKPHYIEVQNQVKFTPNDS